MNFFEEKSGQNANKSANRVGRNIFPQNLDIKIAAPKHRPTALQSSRHDCLRHIAVEKDNPKGTSAPWLLTGPGTARSVVEQPQIPYRRVKGGYKGIAHRANDGFRTAPYIMGHQN